jgi:hypothetical protein
LDLEAECLKPNTSAKIEVPPHRKIGGLTQSLNSAVAVIGTDMGKTRIGNEDGRLESLFGRWK